MIAKHASTPDFIIYTEDLGGKLNKQHIRKSIVLFRELKALHTSLSWPQKLMQQILVRVAEIQQDGGSWKRALSATECKEYSRVMACRIRAMARHIRQAEMKKSKWLETAFANNEHQVNDESDGVAGEGENGCESEAKEDDEEEDAEDEAEDEEGYKPETKKLDEKDDPKKKPAGVLNKPAGVLKKPAAAVAHTYGFDEELEQAWKEAATGKSRREFAPLTWAEDADDGSHPLATFRGNDIHKVTQVTVGEMKAKLTLKLNARGTLWAGKTKCGKAMWLSRIVVRRLASLVAPPGPPGPPP